MKQFMPEVSDRERLQLLRDNADKVEESKYYIPLTPDLLDAKREELTDNAIKLSEMEDELNEVKSEFKFKMDPLKLSNRRLLIEVKIRQELRSGTLFYFANHDDGMMETYDESGLMVASRRLLPDERQKTILSALRPAANH